MSPISRQSRSSQAVPLITASGKEYSILSDVLNDQMFLGNLFLEVQFLSMELFPSILIWEFFAFSLFLKRCSLNQLELAVRYFVIREENNSGECDMRDSFSIDSCSDESESDKLWRSDGCSSEDGGFELGSSPWPLKDRLGYLYFQFFDKSNPYGRVPLMDKVLSPSPSLLLSFF